MCTSNMAPKMLGIVLCYAHSSAFHQLVASFAKFMIQSLVCIRDATGCYQSSFRAVR